MAKITIAGGTGFIGQCLEKSLVNLGHEVFILTRNPRAENHIYWNLATRQVEMKRIATSQVLINLCGEGISDAKWTEERKEDLVASRTESSNLLFTYFRDSEHLQCYITASGINCYPLNSERVCDEEDAFGEDFVSQLVKTWESAADSFQTTTLVYKLRMGVVLHPDFGALRKFKKIANFGLLAPLGSGQQNFSVIHSKDVLGFIHFIIQSQTVPPGSYNLTTNNISNREFTHVLTRTLRRPSFMPSVPAFVLNCFLGELASLLLTGPKVSNQKLKDSGYNLEFEDSKSALKDLSNGDKTIKSKLQN